MIVAMGRNRVIGNMGSIPWRLRADFQHFRQTTMGHAVIMGRKTWESLPTKPLPGRLNIVLTQRATIEAHPEVRVAHTLEQAIALCEADQEPFVIGGGEIYRLALPLAQRIYRTVVDLEPAGDATFPDLGPEWQVRRESRYEPQGDHTPGFVIQVLEREMIESDKAGS